MGVCSCHPTEYPFYCERHKVRKSRHWVELCNVQEDYWRAWEEGKGPGQHIPEEERVSIAAKKSKNAGCGGCGANAAAMVWDLTKSLAAFVSDGFQLVDDEAYKKRLEICDRCEHRRKGRCRLCGCFISIKAKGRAWDCPDGRWPRDEKG